jgi:hypothetical protein
MNPNQIRHLLSAHEDANLMGAEVKEVSNQYWEVAEMAPFPVAAYAAAAPVPDVSYRPRTIRLREKFSLRGQVIRAVYDYQLNTIFFRYERTW